jgi:putative membrane protein
MVAQPLLWKRASDLFTDADRVAVSEAVARAEDRTSGEIIPVVATVSGDYERAEGIIGLLTGLIFLSAAWLLLQDISEPNGSWGDATLALGLVPVLLVTLLGFVAGSLLSRRILLLRMPFVTKKEMSQKVERAAADAYQRFRVSRTAESTGVVLYVSLSERMVAVLGDGPITEKLHQKDWEDIRDLVVAGLKAGRPADGLCSAIARSGEILSRHFPLKPGDVNELHDQLRLLD